MNINYFIIVQDIYSSFNCNPTVDVRGVFLDMSKAFDRVWLDGLIHKIKCIWNECYASQTNKKLFGK